MAPHPNRSLRRALLAGGLSRRFVPRTRLAQVTAYIVGVTLVFWLAELGLRAAGFPASASFAGGWAGALRWISLALLFVLLMRWIRQRFLWSLRRRLFASYFFIGVIPIVLLLMTALVVGYLFAGQFATFVAVSEIRKELDTMATANQLVSDQMAAAPGAPEKRARELVGKGEATGVVMSVWLDGKPLAAQPGSPAALPAWVKESENIIAVEGDAVALRAISTRAVPGGKLVVLSNKDLKQEAATHLAKSLGTFNVWVPDFTTDDQNWDVGGQNKAAKGPRLALSTDRPKAQIRDRKGNERGPTFTTGTLPPPTRALDNEIVYGTPYEMTEWSSGKRSDGLLGGRTRYSVLYPQLFANMSSSATIVLTLLLVAAVGFGVIELVALFIGIGLSHSMTSSISNLYKATQHIKRADFSHRIEVRGRDQLAELQRSFNAMTEDIEHLIVEQKEKQKLQSELAIAQEVQDQLFPHNPQGLTALEVHGVCKPARTVSGDYYDFIPFGAGRLGIAVGDISGKGISAALMMATVHSAMRAYERLGQAALPALTQAAAAKSGDGEVAARLAHYTQSPASALTLLNRHLYETTPLEKYATLFLGIYDERERSLLYSNGGHLPPYLIGADAGVRKLEAAGGLMVGLFDHPKWEDASVELRSGDLFVAFSDGVIEPENEFGEFGTERLL
ncbi:MAG TPA: SpoIIE family protein phosphatase, partial [Terriglobales bacterium]|nr:SpoIIE family protein phosphatase [Terriglobales bacterium]